MRGKQHRERERGVGAAELVGPAVSRRGVGVAGVVRAAICRGGTGDVAALFEQDAEVVSRLGVAALVRAR